MPDDEKAWLVPFKGRNASYSTDLNFLLRMENIYVMDNHRAALWCWLRHLDTAKPVNFLHVDMHWDSLNTITDEMWLSLKNKPHEQTVDEYLNEPHVDGEFKFKMYRWDNYIPPFFKYYGSAISRSVAACHGVGDKIEFSEEIPPHNFVEGIENVLNYGEKHKWIVNIDCDYFFSSGGKGRLFHDDVLRGFSAQIASLREADDLLVLTLALSPECCGGWSAAESVAETILDELGLKLSLPA